MLYSEQLVEAIKTMFQLSLTSNYQPLQEETLVLLSSMASTLSSLFSSHYATFMPGLRQILDTTPSET